MFSFFFFFQAEDGIRDHCVTGVQTCALPILAIGDELGMISSPLTIVRRRDGDLAELRDLAVAKEVDRLVIGLPTGLSGREGPQAAVVREFADALGTVVGPAIRVVFWDERLTTAVAERMLHESGSWRRRRKGDVDAVAA